MTGAAAPPPGWRLRIHESLPSTSDLLQRLAVAGEPEGLAIMARRQTGGRGRDGRAWESPAGNLYLSLLLRPGGPARESGQWALLAAVVMAEGLARFAGDPAAIRVKWPNDVLLGGAKLAGVLCEGATAADGRLDWFIMGIGANLAAPPALADRPTAGLGAVPPEQVAVAMLEELERFRAAWRAEGFGVVRAAWMARGPAPDAPLALRGGTSGRYAGLAEDGCLLLAREGRVLAVATGEVADREAD
ncbi:biotin--[acetyl-CoA-carboxylase] ligase [Falsiroseomonas selenitidurans]|uniref:Biotin--[acetyl-CoA-carboxylase] ligase n=1 Tax=Falsiroseomonas selenitidurans TaxID=2716335 RepID=A0ABX1E8Y1_9PROT|nr:biotin--[acetyl-CoA-carboxylase] ligase [Falsiroseomonas selenitidurans]NKC31360.1 biotin--[acetyl-CoA-carboxylase] ligase [Falsiroseomonas selenitidurans]